MEKKDFHIKALQEFTAAELELLPLWQLDKAFLSALSLPVQQRKGKKINKTIYPWQKHIINLYK